MERHLKRDEVIHPLVELGKFRGEPVYSRSSVLSLKTAENWMRQGRTVVAGAQPLKWVKQRAVTVNKKRAIELALADQRDRAAASASSSKNGPDENRVLAVDVDSSNAGTGDGDGFAAEEGVMQGLYAEHQTEVYKPPPVIDVSSIFASVRSYDQRSFCLRCSRLFHLTCLLDVPYCVLSGYSAGQSPEERFREPRPLRSVYASCWRSAHTL